MERATFLRVLFARFLALLDLLEDWRVFFDEDDFEFFTDFEVDLEDDFDDDLPPFFDEPDFDVPLPFLEDFLEVDDFEPDDLDDFAV
ncbi:MAG: hypothetical protein HDS12_06495 [Bacteroides sp.]|nr:hypothetical protein [Bacteroides sp.]